MGKISAKDAMEKFSGGERSEFFSLKEDKETAVVRFLYEGEDDLDIYLVHEVYIQGKRRWVECLQDDCPLCAAGNRPTVRLFLQLIDYRDNKIKIWERGKKFIPQVIGYINKYGKNGFYKRKFEIERHGKPKSTDTTYQMYPLDPDDIQWNDLPERQELLGPNAFILQKSYEEMKQLASGNNTENVTKRNTYKNDEDIPF